MKDKLLILGAAAAQVPIIQKAQAMGFEVLVASTPGEYPGLRVADRALEVDIRDRATLLDIARREGVRGVLTDQTDVGVPSAAFVAEHLDLPGIGLSCALKFTDKIQMRRAAQSLGVPTPRFVEIVVNGGSWNESVDFEPPYVVKPADSQGSRGVRLVNEVSELDGAVEEAANHSPSHRVIVEQYFAGKEVVIQGFASNYRFWNMAIGDREYFDLPGIFIPKSTFFPSALPEAIQHRLLDLNSRLVSGLRPRFGISHSEFLVNVDTGEACLVEVAIRGGGAFIASDLVPHTCGVDLGALLIEHASGRVSEVDLDALDRRSRSAGYFFFELPEGEIMSVSGVEEVRLIQGVRRLCLDGIRDGIRTRPLVDKTARAGPVVVVGDHRNDCLGTLDEVQHTLQIQVRSKEGIQKIKW